MNKEMSLSDLVAKKPGTSKSSLSRYERNLGFPSPKVSIKLGEVLGFDGRDFYSKRVLPWELNLEIQQALVAKRTLAHFERSKEAPLLKGGEDVLRGLLPLSQTSAGRAALQESIQLIVKGRENNLEKDMVPLRGIRMPRWGAFILWSRQRKGWTGEVFSKKLGISKSSVARIEGNREIGISLKRMVLIGNLLYFDGETLYFKEVVKERPAAILQPVKKNKKLGGDLFLLKAGVNVLRELSSIKTPVPEALKRALEVLQQAMDRASAAAAGAEERVVLNRLKGLDRVFGSAEGLKGFGQDFRESAEVERKGTVLLFHPSLVEGPNPLVKLMRLLEIQGNLQGISGWREEIPLELELLLPEKPAQLIAQGLRVIVIEPDGPWGVLPDQAILLAAARAYLEAVRERAGFSRPFVFRVDVELSQEMGEVDYPTFVVGLMDLLEAA